MYVIDAYFVESMIVLGVVVNWLSNKDTLLARIVVFPLMVDFNVLLHHAVLARLEGAPGANAPEKKVDQKYFGGFPMEFSNLSKLSSPWVMARLSTL